MPKYTNAEKKCICIRINTGEKIEEPLLILPEDNRKDAEIAQERAVVAKEKAALECVKRRDKIN